MKKNLFVNGEVPTQFKDWFLTDDDCFQYCKVDPYDKKRGTYRFVQSINFGENDYSVVNDTIDIYDFYGVNDEQAYEYIIDLLSSYGYGMNIIRENMDNADWASTLLIDFKSQYGDRWKQVFAECIFEDQIFSADVVDKHMNYKEMTKCLSDFLQNN